MLRGRAGAHALVPPADPVGLAPLIDLEDAVPLVRETLPSQAKALSRRTAKASQSREAAEVGANLVPTELSLVGWNVTEGRVPSLAKGANTTLRVRRWWAPSGQVLESVRTGTEPPFEFAYNPYDKDMIKMLSAGGVVEPTLTQLWGEQTRECCSTSNSLVVDVGGNFGCHTL